MRIGVGRAVGTLTAVAGASAAERPTFSEVTAEAGITFERSFGDHDPADQILKVVQETP